MGRREYLYCTKKGIGPAALPLAYKYVVTLKCRLYKRSLFTSVVHTCQKVPAFFTLNTCKSPSVYIDRIPSDGTLRDFPVELGKGCVHIVHSDRDGLNRIPRRLHSKQNKTKTGFRRSVGSKIEVLLSYTCIQY
jgi:hypothetical protein